MADPLVIIRRRAVAAEAVTKHATALGELLNINPIEQPTYRIDQPELRYAVELEFLAEYLERGVNALERALGRLSEAVTDDGRFAHLTDAVAAVEETIGAYQDAEAADDAPVGDLPAGIPPFPTPMSLRDPAVGPQEGQDAPDAPDAGAGTDSGVPPVVGDPDAPRGAPEETDMDQGKEAQVEGTVEPSDEPSVKGLQGAPDGDTLPVEDGKPVEAVEAERAQAEAKPKPRAKSQAAAGKGGGKSR